MKRKVLSGLLATLAFAVCICSCTESNNNEYEYNDASNECIVTSLTMGSLKREMHTKDSIGNDSTFYVSVTGALYPMTIDQMNLRIYNLDSLPYGTDTRRTVFTAINTIGGYTIRSLYSGNDTIFTLSDSTDFSKPRILTVHALNGTSKREYLISINVHQQEGDSMVWNKISGDAPAFAELSETRSFAVDQQLLVFGNKKNQPNVAIANNNGTDLHWDMVPTSLPVMPQSIIRFQNQFYAINNEQHVCISSNGIDWNTLDSDFTANTLAVAGTKQMVALKDGKFFSSADGITWTADEMDDVNHLPAGLVSGTVISSNINQSFETLVVVAECNGKNIVWKREIDLTGNDSYPWIYLPETSTSKFNIPDIENFSVNTYDGVTLLTGLTQENNLAPLYLSRDNGRTWKTEGIKTPAEAQAHHAVAVTVDQNNFIWMFCGETGEVWRGRINRLGWTEVPGAFEKSVHL